MDKPGTRIKELRQKIGWSTLDLASACAMREAFLIEIEDGVQWKVNTLTYRKIADALGVSVGYILGHEQLDPKTSLKVELSSDMLWFTTWTMRLVISLGALALIVLILCIAGLAMWGASRLVHL